MPRGECCLESLRAAALSGFVSPEQDLMYVELLLGTTGGLCQPSDAIDKVFKQALGLLISIVRNAVAIFVATPRDWSGAGNFSFRRMNDDIGTRQPQCSAPAVDCGVVSYN